MVSTGDYLTKKKHFVNRYGALSGLRTNFESEWKSVRDYLSPDAGAFNDPIQEKTQKKDAFYKQNINTLPYQYMVNLATALSANLTPSKLRWFGLSVPNATREEDIWLKKATDKMYSVFASSGLYEHLYTSYHESAVFGPNVLGMQYDPVRLLDFVPTTIGEFWIAEGYNGLVNCCYRRFAMSNIQLFEQFGENIPERIKLALERDDTEGMNVVIHAVEENPRYLPNWDNSLNKPYISVYFLDGGDDDFLEYKGLSKFPYMVARWNKVGKNLYGSGIGRSILGDVKSLQSYEQDLARASKKRISPPLKGSLDLKNSIKDTSANSITYTDDPNGLTPLYNVSYDTGEAVSNIQRVAQRIYESTYNNLFYALLNKDKTMSATEAGGIQQEQLMMLGSVVERLQSEFLKPLIESAFSILYENGYFEEPPSSLVGKELDIQYQSLLSITQDIGDLSLLERWISFVSSVAGLNPMAARKPDVLAIVDYYGDKLGIDLSLTKTTATITKEVQDEQAAAQEQMAREQQLEALDVMSKSAKNLSGTDTNAQQAISDLYG